MSDLVGGCIKLAYGPARIARMCSLPSGHEGVCAPECKLCRGARWVCEKHPHMEWPSERGIPHDDCMGPGEPCPTCNTGHPPEMPPEERP